MLKSEKMMKGGTQRWTDGDWAEWRKAIRDEASGRAPRALRPATPTKAQMALRRLIKNSIKGCKTQADVERALSWTKAKGRSGSNASALQRAEERAAERAGTAYVAGERQAVAFFRSR